MSEDERHTDDESYFCHLVIPSQDLSASKRFYEAVFGWKVQQASGSTTLDILPASGPSAELNADEDRIVPAINTSDIEGKLALIVQHGGRVLQARTPIGPEARYGYYALFEDPQGNRMCLYSESAPPEGTAPADFSLRYEWNEGSVPPPDYYQYTIHIGPGPQSRIVFLPDYPMHNPPTWTEEFAVAEERLRDLYELMVGKGVFRRTWEEKEDAPIGGSLEWLEVTAHGEQFGIPSVPEDPQGINEVYAAIRGLVPEVIWGGLLARHAEFARRYSSAE